jgi:2-(3-amino-3-carboxypropyl)histidine synthase
MAAVKKATNTSPKRHVIRDLLLVIQTGAEFSPKFLLRHFKVVIMSEAPQAIQDSSASSFQSSNPPAAAPVVGTIDTAGAGNVVPRRIVRRRPNPGNQVHNVAIDPILLKEVLDASNLPVNVYSFEIERTVQRCVSLNATHVALQMPEGLLLYATVLVDVLQKLVRSVTKSTINLQVSILSDVTYGACCIDDLTASQLGCQLLIHYGHSCLVPIQHTVIPVQYVFVEIQFYIPHLVQSLRATLFLGAASSSSATPNDDDVVLVRKLKDLCNDEERLHLYLLGTIQFRHALVEVKDQLLRRFEELRSTPGLLLPRDFTVSIPQCKPLSPGEVLGCTSPTLNAHLQEQENGENRGTRAVVCFVADGRFHLESTMIANHTKIDTFYRYDPYSRVLSIEAYGASFILSIDIVCAELLSCFKFKHS